MIVWAPEAQPAPGAAARAAREKRRGRGRGQPARDRRGEIIAAAIRVIARDGIRACTVSALERATGFARGHFTYHFTCKEEIIGLAFATVASDWATTQAAVPAGPARQEAEARVRAAVAWAQRRPDYFRCLMSFRVEMMHDATAFRPAPRIRAQMWDLATRLIRRGIDEGAFHPRGEPAIEARAVFASVDGMLLHAALDEGFCPPGELADWVWQLVADRLGVADTAAPGPDVAAPA